MTSFFLQLGGLTLNNQNDNTNKQNGEKKRRRETNMRNSWKHMK